MNPEPALRFMLRFFGTMNYGQLRRRVRGESEELDVESLIAEVAQELASEGIAD